MELVITIDIHAAPGRTARPGLADGDTDTDTDTVALTLLARSVFRGITARWTPLLPPNLFIG